MVIVSGPFCIIKVRWSGVSRDKEGQAGKDSEDTLTSDGSELGGSAQ